MNMDDQTSRRWIGVLFAGTLVLGACGSATSEPAAADDPAVAVADEPDALALAEDAPGEEAPVDDAAPVAEFDIDSFESLEDLEQLEVTPELFEAIRSSETARPIVLAEMESQGLTADQANCFLDTVSPGLFTVFGAGEQPDEEQFAELIELLGVCEMTFGAVD